MRPRPLYDRAPDDPDEILRVLPEQYHAYFLDEYREAARAASEPENYRRLLHLLRLWRLRAIAYSAPGYEDRLAAFREAVRTGDLSGSVPIENLVPDWPGRLRRAGQQPRSLGAR